MKFIDMHCDTLMPFVRGGDYNLFSNIQHINEDSNPPAHNNMSSRYPS